MRSIFIFLFALGLGVFFLLRSDLFTIKKVEVEFVVLDSQGPKDSKDSKDC